MGGGTVDGSIPFAGSDWIATRIFGFFRSYLLRNIARHAGKKFRSAARPLVIVNGFSGIEYANTPS